MRRVALLWAVGACGAASQADSQPTAMKADGCDEDAPQACLQQAERHLERGPGERDLARDAYRRACIGGLPVACAELAELDFDDDDFENDVLAVSFAFEGCKADIAESCAIVGSAYSYGIGVSIDEVRAADSAKRACALGSDRGCLIWADLLDTAASLELDHDTAATINARYCHDDTLWPWACYALGRASIRGWNEPGEEAAVGFMTRSCTEGLDDACLWLRCVRRGEDHVACLGGDDVEPLDEVAVGS